MTTASLPPGYFEQMFSGDPDPWNFEKSPYEAAKHVASIDALGDRCYRRSLEVGCANGILTQRLAPHCDAIVAIDVSETALGRAQHRNADATHIDFFRMVFPRDAPSGRFDLIVMSEVVYYWSNGDIALTGAWIAKHLEPGGDLLLVHWIGETDYPQTGDEAVAKLHATLPNFTMVKEGRYEKYRLDLWRRV